MLKHEYSALISTKLEIKEYRSKVLDKEQAIKDIEFALRHTSLKPNAEYEISFTAFYVKNKDRYDLVIDGKTVTEVKTKEVFNFVELSFIEKLKLLFDKELGYFKAKEN